MIGGLLTFFPRKGGGGGGGREFTVIINNNKSGTHSKLPPCNCQLILLR